MGGDSGGPLLLLPAKDGGQNGAGQNGAGQSGAILVGVVSWGVDCAEERTPGIYARIDKVLPWIQVQSSEAKARAASANQIHHYTDTSPQFNSQATDLIAADTTTKGKGIKIQQQDEASSDSSNKAPATLDISGAVTMMVAMDASGAMAMASGILMAKGCGKA